LSFADVAKGAIELSKRMKETYPYRWISVILYNAVPFAKASQDFFHKMLHLIFHQPFLLVDFIKFSVLSLILGS